MRKEDSLAIKGIAILMMILYHLFYIVLGGDYISYFRICNISVIERFSEICYPVSLFVLLSGYGLYASYNKSFGDMKQKPIWERAWYLYAHLWIIYLIFLPIACYIDPAKYPGDSLTFIKNITSLACTYNAEQWFLLPYLILVLISNLLFNVVRKVRASLVITGSLGLFVFYCCLMAFVGGHALIQGLGVFYQLVLVLGFLFPFCLGAVANKCHWVEFVQKYISKIGNAKVISIILILVLICVRFFIHNQSLQTFCVLILFLLFPLLPIENWCKQVLMYFGKHSMNMWLIHTWFCYYLFKNFIYGFKYPIIIFIVTTILSLLTSIVVEYIYKLLASWFAKVRIAIK